MKGFATAMLACPCGQRSGRSLATLAACCGPRLSGEQPAPDAEALMRSRYTAYVLGHADYLLATWHERTRPATLELEQRRLQFKSIEQSKFRYRCHIRLILWVVENTQPFAKIL